VSALRALAFADLRSLANGAATIARQPWRVLLWVLWIAAIVGFGWLRTAHPRPPRGPLLGEIALQDFWICAFAIGFGVVLAAGAPRLTGFFSSRAEASLLVRAPLPPTIVAAYLQARAVALTVVQSFGRFAYVILLVLPVHVGPLGLAREMLLLATATVATVSIALPRALARGAWRAGCIAAGSAIVLLALLPLLRDALLLLVRTPGALGLARGLPAWHPGLAFEAVATGDPVPLLGGIAVALVAGAVFVRSARDAYPELYALSLVRLEYRARLHGRVAHDAVAAIGPRAASRAHVPALLRGARALIWVEARTWSRRSSSTSTALMGALSLAVGAGVALLDRASEPSAATIAVLGLLANLTIAFASAAGIRLAADLRRPLFWLGESTLLARLGAWTYASLWRDAVIVLLVAVGYIALSHRWSAACALVLVALGLLILTRAVGVAVFAVLPGALDQRGPAVGLRLLLAYALVTPAAIPALVVTVLARSVAAGLLAGLVTGIVEAALLLGFAAWRLAGRVDRLTTA
jgi:hypothetical protein